MDMAVKISFPQFGNAKESKPERIKAYAYFVLTDVTSNNFDNLVVASSSTNEISISYNGRSDCKVFAFDKVFCDNISQVDVYDLVFKSVTKDVVMGYNCFLVMCNVTNPSITKSGMHSLKTGVIHNSISSLLLDLLVNVKSEDALDSSLHASYFAVHEGKVYDFLSDCSEYKDMKIYENHDQNGIQIQGLIEKPLVNEMDISELLSKEQPDLKHFGCYHTILSAYVVKKHTTSDGFRFIKIGKVTMIDSVDYRDPILLEESAKICSEGSQLMCAGKFEPLPFSCSCKFADIILKSAFGDNAKTSIIVTLSSNLNSPERDLCTLQSVSQARKIFNYPLINKKLLLPNSLKEYSEEIRELQKDLDGISKSNGVKLEKQLYRSRKNTLTVENERIKELQMHLKCLTESVNQKKQNLISVHKANELIQQNIKEGEKSSENLRLEIQKLKNEDNTEALSMKADEILALKDARNHVDVDIKKLKLKKTMEDNSYIESVMSLQSLKDKKISLSHSMNSEQATLENDIKSLITRMRSTSSDVNTLQKDLSAKLDGLSCIDAIQTTWEQNTEKLLSRIYSFIEENNRSLNAVKLKICSSVAPLNEIKNEVLGIIQSNRSEEQQNLSYYFHKIQAFSDSSLKVLNAMMYHLDEIHSRNNTEMKTLRMTLYSSSKEFKKFVNNIDISLKLSKQYFEEQEKELVKMTNIICCHGNFKKHFDENIKNIKSSLSSLKQMCYSHKDDALSKWNEVQKDCAKTAQKYTDLLENSNSIHKEMSKYLDKLAQYNSNAVEHHSIIKDKTDSIENDTNQLLHMHKEMKSISKAASEVNKKRIDKELQEVTEFLNSQKAEVENEQKSFSSTLEAASRTFHNELISMEHVFSNNKEDLKKNLNVLQSSVLSHLATIYNSYLYVSNKIVEESEGSVKVLPDTANNTYDYLPQFESFSVDETIRMTSTPNNAEKKVLNLSWEKEKLLSRIKSIAEQQMLQKADASGSDSEGTERKTQNKNISVISLPNLSCHSEPWNSYQSIKQKVLRRAVSSDSESEENERKNASTASLPNMGCRPKMDHGKQKKPSKSKSSKQWEY